MKAASPLALLVLLAACPGDDDSGNPNKLWLAPDGSEVRLKLQDSEPSPW
jgi:hypothetical protein